ncbi:hypothetical protein ABEK55_14935, partial [Klebsiella pneumoniae]|nr:hypothetical protein [Klebsiella pneumoniae]MCJ5020235.1 hypothetical protein [Klebsiella pneumoniae]
SAQIREILINESAWEEMTCLFALSLINKALSIYLSLFKAVSCFFIFAMHKKLSDSRALLLKLAEDKNTGCMPYL